MFKRITARTLIVCLLTTSAAFGGGAPGITVNAIPCAAPDIHPQVTATVPDDTASARVYFRAGQSNNEYYVDMVRGPRNTMTGLLPMPAAETRTFSYRVVATDRTGREMVSSTVSSDVRETCAIGVRSAPVVLGLTSSGSSIPDGWQCRNVTHYVTTAGVLMNNEECRLLLAGGAPATAAPATATTPATTVPGAMTPATTTPATAAGTTVPGAGAAGAGTAGSGAGAATGIGGLSPLTLGLIAAAGLAAGWFIYDNNREEEEVSPSRP